jgi:hypothetical protein
MSASGKATVSSAGLVTPVAVGEAMITATRGEISGTLTVGVTAAAPVSIEITPPTPSLARGRTLQLTATVRFTDDTTHDLSDQVTWLSGSEAAAMISATGLVASIDPGTTTITAKLGTLTGTTLVTTTDAALDSIEVTPTKPSVIAGRTLQFMATGRFSDNSTQNLTTQVTWDSSDPATAELSNGDGSRGLATAHQVGTAAVTATSGAITGSTLLTVTNAIVESIEVTPATASVPAGRLQAFKALATFSDHSVFDLTSLMTWSSDATDVAIVSNADGTKGRATALKAGRAIITAAFEAKGASATLTVTDPVLVSIDVDPRVIKVVAGSEVPYVATGRFSDSSTLDITRDVTWASSEPGVATISNAADQTKGLATTLAFGVTEITAVFGEVSGHTSLSVDSAVLVSFRVEPAMPSLAVGGSLQFTAFGIFSDHSERDLTTEVSWLSSDAAIAPISNEEGSQGRATALAVGATTITAASRVGNPAVTGTTTLVVQDPAFESRR